MSVRETIPSLGIDNITSTLPIRKKWQKPNIRYSRTRTQASSTLE